MSAMIYIAGPLTNADPDIQAKNIDRAQRVVIPHLRVEGANRV
mgnify:CR=1 FL=1